MQPRAAVTDVVRVVARQHTRMRGLVCEVAQAGGVERQAAAGWLTHYVVLHTAAERLGLGREPGAVAQRVLPRTGPLLGLSFGLSLGLTTAAGLDESAICRCVAALEEAVVHHARAQERTILPRLLASWPPAALWHAAAAFEAADLVFDRGPHPVPAPTASDPAPAAPAGSVSPSHSADAWPPAATEALWHDAVADIERLLASAAATASAADDPTSLVGAARSGQHTGQAPAPTAIATAATPAVTATARATTAVRTT